MVMGLAIGFAAGIGVVGILALRKSARWIAIALAAAVIGFAAGARFQGPQASAPAVSIPSPFDWAKDLLSDWLPF